MLQLIPSFYTIYSKNSLFISANTYEKFVSKDYCIARHDDKMCFLPNCRYHIIIIGNIEELLLKLDAFCFNYQHVDCLYTLFKYRFIGKIVIKSGQFFDNLQTAVHFIQKNRPEEWTECPALQRRNSWGKSARNVCWAPSKRPNRRKLLDHSLQTELNKLKRLNLS